MRYINFFNRDSVALLVSMQKLRRRYHKVEIHRKLKNGLFYGYFCVTK